MTTPSLAGQPPQAAFARAGRIQGPRVRPPRVSERHKPSLAEPETGDSIVVLDGLNPLLFLEPLSLAADDHMAAVSRLHRRVLCWRQRLSSRFGLSPFVAQMHFNQLRASFRRTILFYRAFFFQRRTRLLRSAYGNIIPVGVSSETFWSPSKALLNIVGCCRACHRA